MEPISRLLDLQSLDTAIDRLKARRAALEGEGELGAARAEAERAEQKFGELRLQLDTCDRDHVRGSRCFGRLREDRHGDFR